MIDDKYPSDQTLQTPSTALKSTRRLNPVLLLILAVLPGCAESDPSRQSIGVNATTQQTSSRFEDWESIDQREDLDFHLPGASLEIPEWIGRREDEPFPVIEFLQSRIPEASDSAELYLAGLSAFHPDMCRIYPSDERKRREKIVRNRLDQLKNVPDWDQLLRGDFQIERVKSLLEQYESALALIDRAQQLPSPIFVIGTDYKTNGLPHVQAAREYCRIVKLQLAVSRTDQNFDLAENTLRRTLQLSRDLRARGVLITQLITYAIDVNVFKGIRDFLLPSREINTEQCDRLLALLLEHERAGINRLHEATRMEYLLLGNGLWGIKSGDTPPEMVDELLDNVSLSRIDFKIEFEVLNRLFAVALKSADSPYHEVLKRSEFEIACDQAKGQLERATTQSAATGKRLQSSLLTVLLMPALGQAHEAEARYRTRIRGTIAITAVRSYQLKHGTWPTNLIDAMNDAGIEEIPIDEYSGKPLKYVMRDSQPTVYSVGSDQVDQYGESDWEFGRKPGDFLFQIGLPVL